jgi:hypothetical protein
LSRHASGESHYRCVFDTFGRVTTLGFFVKITAGINTRMNDYVKKPGASSTYTPEQLYDIDQCQDDPFYFIEKFMKVQHPTKGSLPLHLFPFQERLVDAFFRYNKVVALTARQMGKCVSADTLVTVDEHQTEIGTLVTMSPRERVVTWLESKLIDLARRR